MVAQTNISIKSQKFITYVAMMCLVLCSVLFAFPLVTYAEDYSIDQVVINAVVQNDGVLQVNEERTFDFYEHVNGIFWTIPHTANAQGEPAVISNISIINKDTGKVYKPNTHAQSGDEGVFSVEQTSDSTTIKVFSPQDSGASTFVLQYDMINPVMRWADTAELYWKFIGDEWAVDTASVSLRVELPVPKGVTLNPAGDAQVRAWGHGLLTGEVVLEDGGKSISLTAQNVPAYQFAEVRATFPATWLSEASSAGVHNNRLDTILEEERLWAEQSNKLRLQAHFYKGLATVTGIITPVLIVGFLISRIAFQAFKQRRKKDIYFRDVPSQDHPAVLSTFYNKGKVDQRAITATIMKLTDDKLIGLEMLNESNAFVLHLLKLDYEQSSEVDEIDKFALRMFFPAGKTKVTQEEMKSFSSSYREMHYSNIEAFKAEVDARYEQGDFIVSDGTSISIIADLVLAALTALSGMIADKIFWYVPLTVSAILTAIAFALTGFRVVTYSKKGQELKNKCDGLVNWFNDFTRLKEAVPQDVILWNKLLVVAVALGVSQKVIKELATVMPQQPYEEGGYTYYPAYYWYGSYGSYGAPIAVLDQTFAHDIHQLASSSMSSGSGSGGGFSVGGGGGSGGGGGGTF